VESVPAHIRLRQKQANTMQMSINASSATAVTTQLTLRQTCGDDGTTRYTLNWNETVREPDGPNIT